MPPDPPRGRGLTAPEVLQPPTFIGLPPTSELIETPALHLARAGWTVDLSLLAFPESLVSEQNTFPLLIFSATYKLRLKPACLPTCCCLATFPLSDAIHTLFELLPGNNTDIFNDIHIYKYIFHSNSRGLALLGPSVDKFIDLA